jgi:dolichyl-phosphate beta-glucosyltransferase
MLSTPYIQLSVVIPAFNEISRLPGTLRHTIEYLAAQSYISEILVMDDGSTDGTGRLVREWPRSTVPVRLLTHPDGLNHGKGAAVKRGMLAAQGAFRLFMDADNSTTIDQVEGFWRFFEKGYDLVIGSRNVEGSRVEVHQAIYKEWAGRLGNKIIQVFAVPGIRDTQAGFKMFTRVCAEEVFGRLTIERWGYDIEALVIARCRRFRIMETPITWINAPGSKVGLSSYFQVLAEVWRIRSNMRAGRYNDHAKSQ